MLKFLCFLKSLSDIENIYQYYVNYLEELFIGHKMLNSEKMSLEKWGTVVGLSFTHQWSLVTLPVVTLASVRRNRDSPCPAEQMPVDERLRRTTHMCPVQGKAPYLWRI